MSLFTDIDVVPSTPWSGPSQTYRIVKYFMGSFGLAYVFPSEGSVLDRSYDMWKELTE